MWKTRKEEVKMDLDALPEEVILRIISHLDFKSVLTVEKLSEKWHRLALYWWSKKDYVDFENMRRHCFERQNAPSKMAERYWPMILDRCSQFLLGLKTVSDRHWALIGSHFINDSGLPRFPHLTNLTLWHVQIRNSAYPALKNFRFIEAFRFCPTFQEMVKQKFQKNTWRRVNGIPKNLTILGHLCQAVKNWRHLEYLEFVTVSYEILPLLDAIHPSVTELSVTVATQVFRDIERGDRSDDLKKFVERRLKLTSFTLILPYNSFDYVPLLIQINSCIPMLERLIIKYDFSQSSLGEILVTFPNLSYFGLRDFAIFPSITSPSPLADKPPITCHGKKIKIQKFLKNFVSTLNALADDLKGLEIIGNGLNYFPNFPVDFNMKNLKFLKLAPNFYWREEILKSILLSAKNVTEITLNEHILEEKFMRFLGERCKFLTKVNMDSSRSFPFDEVSMMKILVKKLWEGDERPKDLGLKVRVRWCLRNLPLFFKNHVYFYGFPVQVLNRLNEW